MSIDTRIFLLVVDDSKEMKSAMTYACLRAKKSNGRVALLYVIPSTSYQQWGGVEIVMREEGRLLAEQKLKHLGEQICELTGNLPVFYIKEGELEKELLQLLEEDRSISVLVLGASPDNKNPGPLVENLSRLSGKLPIPITIVPGDLSTESLIKVT